ncbi:2-succinyl-5-enolpyruvyl-6-hydroxy-3-cyclohexene-1-carboxylic-acid synthase [Robertkochia marina]|uniref:2-succinyl-5-enolpyruvyl-6-hydroxy-3-cyclohexene-1-carboxylate synthase n=1 Tax=Robertkochia marina TaxID=1227945 RepID=A0A4V3UY52_9FLAO|nr:2-succinyl-5-enolpyruvyl-6-hydroxy-3-cyclohexene-1-carboxylic-acid synthase [Robertkochia marina]THD67766.1 2-succinyl-5-enolpyruvyl-6-hydroxy-3-cyclohexene-1-carboxylic-acid synthase [Robertkochia marina]TRZ40931.1 2-succinyl-5-enolpyruvyl-6-hydroxy-3-cyclohexene-1-carboxylic-acid synthase [Robertkochia marina]
MTYPDIPLAQTIVHLCKAKGIQHIVISPGSRNAPLTIGFTSDPYFSTYSIVDERSAAFFAMGMAMQQKQPVVVVCTSGSALLNYYPAVSEAFYSDVPLVVISADRPPYRIDIGDGQTIRQDNIFERHILYTANLKQDLREDHNPLHRDQDSIPPAMELAKNDATLQKGVQQYNETEINNALNTAIEDSGPVHLNAPFEEPLYNRTEAMSVSPKNIAISPVTQIISEEEITTLQKLWNGAARKIVMVGVLQPNTLEQKLLDRLVTDDSVVLLTETTSNLHQNRAFPFIDKLIAPLEKMEDATLLWQKLQPEILLTFGGMVVSKKVKAFLRKYQPKHHWHVDPKKAYDTYFCLERHIKTDINTFLKRFVNGTIPVANGYFPYWEGIRKNRTLGHLEYMKQIPFCDFKVYEHVLKKIPDGTNLQLSNSSTIRYAQLFQLNSSLKVFCNRGTSGIDGSTSTAVGAAFHDENATVMVTGDLSFFYDSNALWNNYLRKDFRIIVINNGGGGIFRILPGDKNSEAFNTYFETTHELNARGLCDTFGLRYIFAENEEELIHALDSFYEDTESPGLLEVFTPRTVNDEVLLKYFRFLAEWNGGGSL